MTDEEIKENVKTKIKDMTLEELQIALEEQNAGLFNDLKDVILSQIEVIKQQQSQISHNVELTNRMVNVVKQIQAKVEMLVEKQKSLEEFAIIGAGLKKVAETNIGKEKILENLEESFAEKEKKKNEEKDEEEMDE